MKMHTYASQLSIIVVVHPTKESLIAVSCPMAICIIVIHAAEEPVVRAADLIATGIIMIETTPKGLIAVSDLITGCIKVIKSTEETLPALTDLIPVSVIMNDLTEESLSAISLLAHNATSILHIDFYKDLDPGILFIEMLPDITAHNDTIEVLTRIEQMIEHFILLPWNIA